MNSPSIPPVNAFPEKVYIDQDKDDSPEAPKSPENQKGELAAHAVEWLSQLMNYTGIVALITAAASVTFLVRAEDPQNKKVGEYIGNCYVVAEVVLVFTIISLVALKIFIKARG